jgi:hypothetical protein
MSSKPPFIRAVFALFFWPSRAKKYSRESHARLAAVSQTQEATDQEPWPDQQISILRRAWMKALLVVASVLLLGYVVGRGLGFLAIAAASFWQVALQYTGAGLLLWITLAPGGWAIETHKSVTFAEQLDSWVYRVVHVTGTFMFVVGTAWQSMAGP